MRDRYNLGTGTDDGAASKTTATTSVDRAEVTNIPGTVQNCTPNPMFKRLQRVSYVMHLTVEKSV